jgi:hypothetical protein
MRIVIKYNSTEEQHGEAAHAVKSVQEAAQIVPSDKPSTLVPFGRAMRDQFLFADGYRNINHGTPSSLRLTSAL